MDSRIPELATMRTCAVRPGATTTRSSDESTTCCQQTEDSCRLLQQQALPSGKRPCIHPQNLSFIREVGSGTYAKTWLAMDKVSGQRVLAKMLTKTEKNRRAFMRELRLSVAFSEHPNIIHTYEEAYENGTHRVLIQEFADGGDLCSAIKSGVGLSQFLARRYLGQVATALRFVHSRGYVHRDVKPENVVLVNVPCDGSAKYGTRMQGMTVTHAKLIDFGMTCRVGTELFPGKVKIPYVPPELLSDSGSNSTEPVSASPAMDLWSLGVTLFTMLTGMFPWQRAHPDDVHFAAFAHWQQTGDDNAVPPMFRPFSWQLLELFSQLLALEPERRCSASCALRYLDVPWFYCAGDTDTSPTTNRRRHLGVGLSTDSGISEASGLSCDSSTDDLCS